MKYIIGIDDSGRGPLIGPMVLAGVLADATQEAQLKRHGIKDSKMLTAKRREELSEFIKKVVLSFHITKTFPQEIDSRIAAGINLNKIEAIRAAEIINTLTKNGKSDEFEVIIDCPSPNIESWKNYVSRFVKNPNVFLKCEHKADVHHTTVSAASIIAKVARDEEVAKIRKQIGIDFGSGYPSDPRTMKFLENYAHQFKHDGFFRKSWVPWKRDQTKREQKSIKDF